MATGTEVQAPKKLPAKRQLFIDFYLGSSHRNATDAARRAGYAKPEVEGHRLLRNAAVMSVIAGRTMSMMDKDEVLVRLSTIARADLAEVTDLVGMDSASAIKAEMRRLQSIGASWLIRKLTPTKHGLAVELHSSQEALNTLAKYHGLLVDRVKISPDIDWDALSPEQLERIAEGKGL